MVPFKAIHILDFKNCTLLIFFEVLLAKAVLQGKTKPISYMLVYIFI